MTSLEWNTRRRGEAARLLDLLFRRSFTHFGPQHWWPGETREEVVIGAVLTQNTSWTNVEKALGSLRKEIPITLRAVAEIAPDHLARHIRPVGYFTLKTRRLQAVARWFVERCGPAKPASTVTTQATLAARASAAALTASPSNPIGLPIPARRRFPEDGQSVDLSPLIGLTGAALEALRQDILAVYGVGPETADSILLYALDGETFVIDAYTLRVFERHGVFPPDTPYEDAKLVFEALLGRDLDLFNEYHAQIVALGKHFCKTRSPLCDQCPLGADECFAHGKRLS